MKTIQEMAREAGAEEVAADNGDYFEGCTAFSEEELERFVALVRENAIAEANAKANASWTLMCEKMVAIEREACAKVCDTEWNGDSDTYEYTNASNECAAAIRERSNT